MSSDVLVPKAAIRAFPLTIRLVPYTLMALYQSFHVPIVGTSTVIVQLSHARFQKSRSKHRNIQHNHIRISQFSQVHIQHSTDHHSRSIASHSQYFQHLWHAFYFHKNNIFHQNFQEHEFQTQVIEIFVPLSSWLNGTSCGVEPSIFSTLENDYQDNLNFEKTLGSRAERTEALIPTVTTPFSRV